MINLTFWMVVGMVAIIKFLAQTCSQFLGFAMRCRWTRKSVGVEALVSIVESFFADRGFTKISGSSGNKGKRVMRFGTREGGTVRSVEVSVCDIPDGFEVEFATDQSAEILAKMGAFTTLYGVGLFINGKLRHLNPGFFERLEADFWDFVELRISDVEEDTKA